MQACPVCKQPTERGLCTNPLCWVDSNPKPASTKPPPRCTCVRCEADLERGMRLARERGGGQTVPAEFVLRFPEARPKRWFNPNLGGPLQYERAESAPRVGITHAAESPGLIAEPVGVADGAVTIIENVNRGVRIVLPTGDALAAKRQLDALLQGQQFGPWPVYEIAAVIEPHHPTVGHRFRTAHGAVARCTSYDSRIGFWMEDDPDGPNARSEPYNVSERAIGRTFHRIYENNPDNEPAPRDGSV